MDEKKREDEKKIPVFTVFKNNSILKNIFLLLDAQPPLISEPNSKSQEDEEVLVIGRHPDCSITLDHPSISRFHLRLHSKPSSLKLSLVDLSSVHGTWVSGKKVEPGVQVDLNEGDTVRLGGSSRLYMLHWVPISQAYDLDDPFVPPMDVFMPVKEREELTNQDENCCSSIETNQIQSLCVSLEDFDSSISGKEVTVSPSVPLMPEFGDYPFDNDEEAKKGNLSMEEHKQNEISGFSFGQPLKEELVVEEIENQHSDKENENLPNASSPSNDHNKDRLREEHKEIEISSFSSGSPLKDSVVAKFKIQQSDEENDENPQALAGLSTGITYAKSSSGNHNKDLLREEREENEISGYSSGTPLKESVVAKFEFSSGQLLTGSLEEIENQQSHDENDENPQALAGLSTGIAHAKSPSGDHNKNLLRREEHEISAFSSGQLLNDSAAEIKDQQSDEEYENSQTLGEHPLREDHEENEISGFSSGQFLKGSVEEIENQQSGEEFENSQAFARVISGIDHNEHPLREEREENEISGFSSGQLLKGSVEENENQQSDEEYENSQALARVFSGIANVNSPNMDYNKNSLREENEISRFLAGPLLKESVAENENQRKDKENENPQVLDKSLSGIGMVDSPSQSDHNKNLLEFFNSSFSDDVEIIFASKMDNEQGRMSTSGCDSDVILESKDQLFLYEQNQVLDYSSSSAGVHEGQPLKNTPSESEQEINWSENLKHSLHDEDDCTIVDERSEAADDESSLKGVQLSCHNPCSNAILDSKDQLYLYEQNYNLEYSTSSGVHKKKPLKKTPSKSEQEINWSENLKHSLSDEDDCTIVGERSEAVDNESSLKGDNEQKEIPGITFGALKMDMMNLSLCCENIPTEDCIEQLDEKNNTGQTIATNVSEHKETDVITLLRSGQRSDPPIICSSSGRPTSIDIETGRQERNSTGFTTDTKVKQLYQENMDNESVSEVLMSSVEVYAEEIFTPDKENFTPNTLQRRSTKKTYKVEESNLSKPLGFSSMSKNSVCWNFVQNEELLFSSDKENHTPKVLQEHKLVRPASKNQVRLKVEAAIKNRISRVPFQSLLFDSSSKSCSNDPNIRSSNSGKNAQPIEKNTVAGDNKRWIMVADTNCLLNKVSRKALQLLQGVKGTQLIIPRVVIREMDCMKRRGYLFTRTTEISSALQWIEDCMINTNWWIHVQSSTEEGRHLAPTPPASLSISEGENKVFSFSSAPFYASPNFLEIDSPTPGDHILDCALLCKRMKNDKNLVILSDDVSLKIKAMAEGMICEAAEEFRESLVNPFSDRFLWSRSSPRGLTWSCVDDFVLREKYYRGPLKTPSKSGESLKGLKLILLHNSHFSGLIPN